MTQPQLETGCTFRHLPRGTELYAAVGGNGIAIMQGIAGTLKLRGTLDPNVATNLRPVDNALLAPDVLQQLDQRGPMFGNIMVNGSPVPAQDVSHNLSAHIRNISIGTFLAELGIDPAAVQSAGQAPDPDDDGVAPHHVVRTTATVTR